MRAFAAEPRPGWKMLWRLGGLRVCRQCWQRWSVGVKALGPDQPERDPVTSSLATDPQVDKGPVSETRTAGDPHCQALSLPFYFKVR